MKVWLDGQCFQTQSCHGEIGRSALELVRAIRSENSDVELMLSLNAAMPWEAITARVELAALVGSENISLWEGASSQGEVVHGTSSARKLSEVALAHHVNCLEPDLALSLSPFEGNSDPAVPLLPSALLEVPLVGMFYDAAPHRFPEAYLSRPGTPEWYERRLAACKNFDALLCMSGAGLREAQGLFPRVDSVNLVDGSQPVGSEQAQWKSAAGLAVQAMRRVRAAREALPPPRAARRAKVAEAAVALPGAGDSAARILAVAEPAPPAPARLLVEVTTTVRTSLTSGIQRVVRKTGGAMMNEGVGGLRRWPRTHFAYCDDAQGWFEAPNPTALGIEKAQAAVLRPRGSDTILLLDSSWDVIAEQTPFLIEARMRGAEITSCLYDLVPLKVPAFCSEGVTRIFRRWLLHALSVSTSFVCISRTVADELLELLKTIEFPHQMKVGYWPLGADFAALPANAAVSKKKRARPMFLMVGTLEPRKGHRVALEAFEQLWSAGVDVELVIAGRAGWKTVHLSNTIKRHPEYGDRLFWREEIDDAELMALYGHCDCLVAASYAEGFGLPIVEAAEFGKPVIASDLPVFREVAGGSSQAMFFEVGNPTSLADRVQAFLATPVPRALDASASPPVKWPNWSESATRLREVLQGDWYQTYEPAHRKPFLSRHDLGRVTGDAPLPEDARQVGLSVAEGPRPADGGWHRRMIVAVTNKSSHAWLGEGTNGHFGVKLGFRLLRKDGSVLQQDNLRSEIALVLAAGETQYLEVQFLDQEGAALVELEMVQEGVAWWGNPLTVPLS